MNLMGYLPIDTDSIKESKKIFVQNLIGIDKDTDLNLKSLLPDNCDNIVIDFKDLDFIDSEGIGRLIDIYKYTLSRNIKLQFTNVSKSVRDLFFICQLDKYLDLIM